MRKGLWFVCCVGLALSAPFARAAGSVMVLSVAGDVLVENFGKASKVEPFSRLLEGDRVKLGTESKLTVVYAGNGRQEAWAGPGLIAAGAEQSAIVAGNPSVQARQLPPQIVQQMVRTPLADSTGKTGMVRMRALPTAEALAGLEQRYRELRSAAAPDDRSPEIYFLAGLFERSAYSRLEQELKRIEQEYPTDDSMQALVKLYANSMANARQTARP